MAKRVKGKIKWFNSKKGYGFITINGGGGDVFLHYSALNVDGFKTILDGADVEFDVIQGQKGDQASSVDRI